VASVKGRANPKKAANGTEESRSVFRTTFLSVFRINTKAAFQSLLERVSGLSSFAVS
jgi:hypothetical protein